MKENNSDELKKLFSFNCEDLPESYSNDIINVFLQFLIRMNNKLNII